MKKITASLYANEKGPVEEKKNIGDYKRRENLRNESGEGVK